MANEARELVDKFWGSDFIQSIPAKWKASFRYIIRKVPGVENTTDPDTITGDVVASQVVSNRINEKEKQTTELEEILTSDTYHGQERDDQFDLIFPFTEHLALAGEEIGDPGKEITPLNAKISEVKEIDVTAAETFLATFQYSYAGKINIDLPDKLLSVTGIIDKVVGRGITSETGTTSFFGANYSISLDLHASAQASAIITPDAYSDIRQFWGNNLDCIHYHFFLRVPVTSAQVQTRLEAMVGEALSVWPIFSPKPVNITCIGRRVSLQVAATSKGADSQQINSSGSGGASASGGGTSFSEETGSTLKIVKLPGTIHGAITVSGTTDSTQSVSATAHAEAEGLGPEENIDASDGGDVQVDPLVATVRPTTIPTCSNATSWPHTGKYLFQVNPTPFKHRFIEYHCVVVDASTFPTAS